MLPTIYTNAYWSKMVSIGNDDINKGVGVVIPTLYSSHMQNKYFIDNLCW